MKIGDRVGNYEILDILGSGGMGKVFKVRNLVSERVEAMKVLLPSSSPDANLLSRFRREIKVQAALDHPNIARLFTGEIINGELVLVMEYVEGTSLEKLLKEGFIEWHTSIDYAIQVLNALGYAHSREVVHRDMKPANIMLTPTGAIKLMDFGIARMKADHPLTQAGQQIGSLAYMAPEQIRGSEPDPRSDIYSFGISLYEMVTGKKPFQGDSDFCIMDAHLRQAPRAPIETIPGISNELNGIVLKALAKDPAARFQTAEAFRAALESIRFVAPEAPPLEGIGVSRGTPRPRWRGLYMALGSFTTLIVLAAVLVEGPKFLRSGRSGAATRTADPVNHASSALPKPAQPAAQSPSGVPPGSRPAERPALVERAQRTPEPPPPEDKSIQQPPPMEPPKDLREQLASLQARAAASNTTLETMSDRLKSQGVALRPDLAVAQNMARIKLATAEAEMAKGEYADARESLGAAEAALQTIAGIYGR